MDKLQTGDRLAFLRQRYRNFHFDLHLYRDPESLVKEDKEFNIELDIPDSGELADMLDQLNGLKERMPQSKNFFYEIDDYRIRVRGVREETDAELDERKQIVAEKNELYNLIQEERDKEQEENDRLTYIKLHERYKDTELGRGSDNAERENFKSKTKDTPGVWRFSNPG